MALDRIQGLNLYIGGVFHLRKNLAKENITHVISVLKIENHKKLFFESDPDFFNTVKHLEIPVLDDPKENILCHFNTTNAFIQAALDEGGNVLVHCGQGLSRSAAICVAYLLNCNKSTLNPTSALTMIQKVRPTCGPNAGFMEQLWIFHQVGCPSDVLEQPEYQLWLDRRAAKGYLKDTTPQNKESSSTEEGPERTAGP